MKIATIKLKIIKNNIIGDNMGHFGDKMKNIDSIWTRIDSTWTLYRLK